MVYEKSLGLSFSGGGANAALYLGFLRGLEQQGLKVDYILGHSGASWLFCFMAGFEKDEELLTVFSKTKMRKFISLNPIKNGGFFSLTKLEKHFAQISKDSSIEDLPYKTCISFADLTDRHKPVAKYASKGSLSKFATISTVIPPLLPLYRENNNLYADGGYVSLYSASKLKDMGAEIVIGLYPDALNDTNALQAAIDTAWTTTAIMAINENRERVEDPVDLEILFTDEKFGLFDFKKAFEMYEAGKNKAYKYLPKIRKLISK